MAVTTYAMEIAYKKMRETQYSEEDASQSHTELYKLCALKCSRCLMFTVFNVHGVCRSAAICNVHIQYSVCNCEFKMEILQKWKFCEKRILQFFIFKGYYIVNQSI